MRNKVTRCPCYCQTANETKTQISSRTKSDVFQWIFRDRLSSSRSREWSKTDTSSADPWRRRPSRRRAFNLLPVVQWTRMTSLLYTFFVLVTTCLPNLPVSYGCSSRSTPKPRPPSPTLRPNITIQTYTCPPEYDAHYCLNGATCFTVKIGESILYNCECAEGYMGQRCEFKDLDGSYLPSKQRAMLEQAGVTGGAAIIVILVVIVCFYLYVRSRRKSKISRRSTGTDVTDGDCERFERRPFSSYYYNNPSISISQHLHSPSTVHHQSDTSGRLEKVGLPLPSSSHSPPLQCPKIVEPPDPLGAVVLN